MSVGRFTSVKDMMDKYEEDDKKLRKEHLVKWWFDKIRWALYRFFVYRIWHSITWFLFKDIKHRHQFGCSEEDIWSLDYTAAKWMIKRLVAMRIWVGENGGKPCELYDFEEDFFLTEQERDEMALQKWLTIIDKITRAFELVVEENDSQDIMDTLEFNKEKEQEYEEGMDLFRKWFRYLWT